MTTCKCHESTALPAHPSGHHYGCPYYPIGVALSGSAHLPPVDIWKNPEIEDLKARLAAVERILDLREEKAEKEPVGLVEAVERAIWKASAENEPHAAIGAVAGWLEADHGFSEAAVGVVPGLLRAQIKEDK